MSKKTVQLHAYIYVRVILMQANKNDWENLDQYLEVFEDLTQSFFQQLDSSAVAKF